MHGMRQNLSLLVYPILPEKRQDLADSVIGFWRCEVGEGIGRDIGMRDQGFSKPDEFICNKSSIKQKVIDVYLFSHNLVHWG